MKRTIHRAALVFTVLAAALAPTVAASAEAQPTIATDSVIFAGGCFWGIQAVFQHTRGVVSATAARREAFAAQANRDGLGPCSAFAGLPAMLASDGIDAVWIASPETGEAEVLFRAGAATEKERAWIDFGGAAEGGRISVAESLS